MKDHYCHNKCNSSILFAILSQATGQERNIWPRGLDHQSIAPVPHHNPTYPTIKFMVKFTTLYQWPYLFFNIVGRKGIVHLFRYELRPIGKWKYEARKIRASWFKLSEARSFLLTQKRVNLLIPIWICLFPYYYYYWIYLFYLQIYFLFCESLI